MLCMLLGKVPTGVVFTMISTVSAIRGSSSYVSCAMRVLPGSEVFAERDAMYILEAPWSDAALRAIREVPPVPRISTVLPSKEMPDL